MPLFRRPPKPAPVGGVVGDALAQLDRVDVLNKAVKVASRGMALTDVPERERFTVNELASAIVVGAAQATPGAPSGSLRALVKAKPMSAQVVAQQARMALGPSSTLTPGEIELAMRRQGIDFAEPFAPGKPLTPYFGYNRRPRERDYMVGRNITTQTRPDRIPFATLEHLYNAYDIAQICSRHAINDLRSMRIRFEAMDGYEENPVKEIARAKQFMRRPDGKRFFRNWLCKHAMDVWRYDAGTLYRHRDRAGHLIELHVAQGTLFAPILDYYGDNPSGEAPAFQQFVQGIPWDWLRWEDLIYEPMWPTPESPYGTPPLETVLVNANTDVRLQTYFLQFFTTGTVPEAFATAPEEMSDPDALEEWQETYNDWTYGDQSQRWGLRWLPHGTELNFYKPQQFDPEVAEYVMRRTVAAFMMVPHDLGFTEDVNRASSETQVDTQFRIGSLPHVSYYEDMLDAVIQEDLGLPVQVRFDTGREKEDRLMEAQAHQIYVSMGSEGPDEVRSKVLGLPINVEETVPRFFDSKRLGPIPLAYLMATAGDIDPLTAAPRKGTVQRQEFVLPGSVAPDPDAGPNDPKDDAPGASGTQYDDNAASDRKRGVGGARPKVSDPTKVYPKPPSALPSAAKPETPPAALPRPAGGSQASKGLGGITTATGIAGAPSGEDDDEDKDLAKWRAQSRKRVAKGQRPREFVGSAIGQSRYAQVWMTLGKATTREQVDAAFKMSAGSVSPGSGMVSLDVAPGTLPVLPGGVPDQHITIVYLGKDIDDTTFAAVCAVAEAVAGAIPGPLRGTIGGMGTFPASESSDWLVPVFAVPDVAGIERLRPPFEVWNASQHKDWHPHMTLAYLQPDEVLPAPMAPAPVTFTHLSVHRGGTVTRFPFGAMAKAKDPEVFGLALVAENTGRVLMVQRGNKDDGNGARLEFPAGHGEPGEDGLDAAKREWEEETGSEFPAKAEQVGTWTSEDGKFQGFVFRTPKESSIDLGAVDGDEISGCVWWDLDDLDASEVRDKVRENLDRSTPLLEQAEKDIAFDALAVGGGPPKAPRPGPGGFREDQVVQHHAAKVRRALNQQANARFVATKFGRLAGGAVNSPRGVAGVAGAAAPALGGVVAAAAATAGVIAGFVNTLSLVVGPVASAVLGMWGSAWLAGAKDGRDRLDQSGVWVPSSDPLDQAVERTDWDRWAPTDGSADLPGTDDVRQHLAGLVQGITETTRSDIAAAITAFVASRPSEAPWTDHDVTELANQIDALVDNPARAMLIARTEVNRAFSHAAMSLFKRSNVAMFDLDAHPTACRICLDIAAANPHPVGDLSATPPIHPQCRCSVSPVVRS